MTGTPAANLLTASPAPAAGQCRPALTVSSGRRPPLSATDMEPHGRCCCRRRQYSPSPARTGSSTDMPLAVPTADTALRGCCQPPAPLPAPAFHRQPPPAALPLADASLCQSAAACSPPPTGRTPAARPHPPTVPSARRCRLRRPVRSAAGPADSSSAQRGPLVRTWLPPSHEVLAASLISSQQQLI
ncbi:Pre-Mrna-Splicing Factor Atp-Dependent Rna Helicase Prp16, partial [Manis pentadactyla]